MQRVCAVVTVADVKAMAAFGLTVVLPIACAGMQPPVVVTV